MKTLKDYWLTHKWKCFNKGIRYYKHGHYLTYFAKDKRCHATQIDEILTIYTSIEDDKEIVGIKLNLKEGEKYEKVN